MDIPDRLARARQRMHDTQVDALLVGPSADLRWLVGYHALALERLTLLLVPAGADPVLVVPALEEPRVRDSGASDHARIVTWQERDDPIALVRRTLEAGGVDAAGRLAVQDRLWSTFLLALQAALPEASWVDGSTVLRPLRAVKTPGEITLLRDVAAAIDRVHATVPDLLRPGRTEADVGRDIADRILDEHDEVNFVIVASGPNGASPHHETGNRVMGAGDAVVVDIGGTRAGYCSDSTRNYVLGEMPGGYQDLYATLEAAQEAAVAAVAPGVPAGDVDAAARRIIADAGYGDLFVHRTGHGIGVEEHEHPYIVDGSTERLEAGMTFSVEPGIYVPGRYGARIEDIVAVTTDGVERLNTAPRTVTLVGGA